MKKVTMVYISDDGANDVSYIDALLVKDNVLIHYYEWDDHTELSINQSETPYRVTAEGYIHYEYGNSSSTAIELSKEGGALDLEELAGLTVAELIPYLR